MRFHTTTIAHLPTGLVSEIINNVRCVHTLYNVSSTCRLFRNLSQAFIFRSFTLFCGNEWDLSRHDARLNFYSSDAIRPFVWQLVIRIPGISNFWLPEHSTFLAKILDELPRFSNIRVLACVGVRFTEVTIRQVSTLSPLLKFHAMECSPPPDSSPMLRVRSFNSSGASHRWLLVLDPDHLKVLCVSLTEELCSFLPANDDPSLSPFPSLHAVQFYAKHEALPMLSMLLPKMPTLRSLKLFPYRSDPELYTRVVEGLVSTSTCPLPHLEEYGETHEILPFILGRASGSESPPASLRRVLLTSVDPEGDPLAACINSFQSCRPCQLRAVTHIHMSLRQPMDFKSLVTLQDLFPFLQVLNLHSTRGPAFTPNVDLDELCALSLPITLESLSVEWTSDWNGGIASDFVAVKAYNMSKLALQGTRPASQSEECFTLHEVGSESDVWDMVELIFPENHFFLLYVLRRQRPIT